MVERPVSILIGVDFSKPSAGALEHGIALATRLHAELTLLHAWSVQAWSPARWGGPELAVVGQTWLDDARESAQRELDGWGNRARRSGLVVRTRLEPDAASRALSEASQRFDLVVLGRRGHAGLAHVVLGSVSERVVRMASCPVLVVPEESAAAHVVPRRLLVGIDFSDASREALESAEGLAEALQAGALVLLHAFPDERELWLESWSEVAEGRWPYDQAALEEWAAPARGRVRSLAIDARVAKGRTESVLVETARDLECDWIVVGVQGRTALAAMLMGATTDRVLKLADRPVLAVPLREAPTGEATA